MERRSLAWLEYQSEKRLNWRALSGLNETVNWKTDENGKSAPELMGKRSLETIWTS
jgi:hypothetical protein